MREEDGGGQCLRAGIVFEGGVLRISGERRVDKFRNRLIKADQAFIRTGLSTRTKRDDVTSLDFK